MLSTAGCNENDKVDPQAEKIAALEQQNADLSDEIAGEKARNKVLLKRVNTLSGIPEKADVEELYPLESVGVTKYTNFYDKDKDGVREVLIVYIEPVDADGDSVKAAGAVDVELWDLGKDASQAKVQQWRVEPVELRKHWYSTLMRKNYRLIFDTPQTLKDFDEPLTVRVTFTDYLTGKVYKKQHVIEPETAGK